MRDDWMEIPSAADAAYADARESFAAHVERITDAATEAHEKGDEAKAQELLAQAKTLTYTGLNWQADNGIFD